MAELEFDNVELWKFYYSKQEQAYFIFLFYNSWTSSLETVVADEFGIKQVFTISRKMWDQTSEKFGREFVFCLLKEESNYKIPRVMLGAILKEIHGGSQISALVEKYRS